MSLSPNSIAQIKDSLNNNHDSPFGPPCSENLKTTPKPLNFRKAMNDFSFMFPEIDRHAIETVLRANNGVVQSTIDQLLVLQESCSSSYISTNEEYLRELSSYDASIGNGEEPPPAYSDVWDNRDDIANVVKEECENILNRGGCIKRKSFFLANNRWKAPLVGELPRDFLRLESFFDILTINELGDNLSLETIPINDFSHRHTNIDDNEDVKLAIMLQNEEFLQELRQNKEFVSSLEADHERAVVSFEKTGNICSKSGSAFIAPGINSGGGTKSRTMHASFQDDVAFRQKLKHMGKSTKKKFSKMAKKFSHRNVGNRAKPIHMSDSRFNLLDNNDDIDIREEGLQELSTDNDIDIDENLSESITSNTGGHVQISTAPRQLPKLPFSRRQLPQVDEMLYTNHRDAGSRITCGNVEPIVFYSEDNEFQYKNDS